jgi:hypothetical protein
MDEFAMDAPTWDELLSDGPWESADAAGHAPDDGFDVASGARELDDRIDAQIDDALDALLMLDRRRAQLAAQEMELLVRIAGVAEQRREVTVLDDATDAERLLTIVDEAREEISAALRRSPTTVHSQLVDARLLFGPLRRTLDALAAGRITEGHARVLAEQGEVLHRSLSADDTAFAAACAELEDRVLVRAESCTRAQLTRLAKAAVAAIDAEGEQARRRDARQTEDVCVQPDDYGQAVLLARLQAADAARIRSAVDAHAASGSLVTPCDATLGQRRVAALLDLVLGTGTAGTAGTANTAGTAGSAGAGVADDEAGAGGDARTLVGAARTVVGAEISVVMTLDEFVKGTGVVGELLEDPKVPLTIRRLITDPLTGRAIDLGRSRYEVSEPLRRWIIARDRTCCFPGCSRRATACQIDHVKAWNDGGATDASNLQPLCTRHHQLKTHGGWQVRRDDSTGLMVWTSPSGRIYWVDPEPVVPPGSPPPALPPPGLTPSAFDRATRAPVIEDSQPLPF